MDLSLSHVHPVERRKVRQNRSRHPLNAARGLVIGGAISAGLWTAIVASVASML